MWEEILTKNGCEIAGYVTLGDYTIELYGEVHNVKNNDRTFWEDLLERFKKDIDQSSNTLPTIMFEHSTILHNYNKEEYEYFATKTYGINWLYFNLMNYYNTNYEMKHDLSNCIVRSIVRKEQNIKEQNIKNKLRTFDNRLELGFPTFIEENITFEMINGVSKIKPNDGTEAIHKIIKVTRFIRDYITNYLPILSKYTNNCSIYNECYNIIFKAILRQKKILDGVLRIPDLEEFFTEQDYFISGINNINIVMSVMFAITKNINICSSLLVDINIINQINNYINTKSPAPAPAPAPAPHLIPFFQNNDNDNNNTINTDINDSVLPQQQLHEQSKRIIILARYSHIKRILALLDNSITLYNNKELEAFCNPLEYSLSEKNEQQFIKKLGMAL